MGKTGGRKVRIRAGRSLNLVLWFSFSVFAVILIVLYSLIQNLLVRRQYREVAEKMLRSAADNMQSAIAENENPSDVVKLFLEVSNRYGVGFYLIYENGENVFPELSAPASFPEIIGKLTDELQGGDPVLFHIGDDMVLGTETSPLGGRNCYLFLSIPSGAFSEYEQSFGWMSFVTALFAIVLAFAASGVVAALITRPVTEVTECAKELSRWNFNLNLGKEYFCSEITELADALDSARKEISKADRMQKELIANVSHDFKTPLTMIKAYASMIREISGEDKNKRDAHAQIIIDESDRLAALVADLLDLSKLRAGLAESKSTVFNLSEEVYKVAGRFEYLKEVDGYRIETVVEDDLYAYANKERIEQVLYNLIGNAVNYTGADKRVVVRLIRKDGGARFEVADSGKGIPPDEIDTIWDRYYRSNKTHKRPVQGTGLGLSIVKGILLSQGCPFGVISEVGKGSCFWVEFPPSETSPQGDAPVKETERKKPKKRSKEERDE